MGRLSSPGVNASPSFNGSFSLSSSGGYPFSGVRPSSGAASSETQAGSRKSNDPTLREPAAPEDGRTPLNTYSGGEGRGEEALS